MSHDYLIGGFLTIERSIILSLQEIC